LARLSKKSETMKIGVKKKIVLKSKGYPYTYARVSVMRSKLLKKAEYHKLLKMEAGSIARYLQESSYKAAIDGMALNYKGIDLIEHSLNKDLVLAFVKLRRISAPEVDLLIDAYAGRWDMHNAKTILRGIYSKADKEYIKSLLIPAGLLTMAHLENMLKKDTVEEALKACRMFDISELKEEVSAFNESGMLIEIENGLDKIYYKKCLETAASVGKEGLLFRKFLLTEIDIINIRNLLRMKKEELAKDDIMRHLIFSGEKLDRRKLRMLAAADSVSSMFDVLKKTDYQDVLPSNVPDSLIDIELELDRMLIRKSFLFTHQYPMSVMSILSYMLSKAMEVKNLKTLAKAKQLGIDEKFIEEKLVAV
jgi:V/A-type H+/Na+-transporting ATPase subunit C